MTLSPHFTFEELTHSQYANRHGINNTPSADVLENLILLAQGLERVRAILAVPIFISSGYRCPKINAAIRGSKESAHMKGLAADFTAPQYGTPLDVCRTLDERRLEIGFDQLIHEGAWVHIAFADEFPRFEVLTATFDKGQTTYTRGLT